MIILIVARIRIMTKFISVIAISILTMPAFALTPAGQGRRTMSSQMMAPRQVAAPQVQASMASAKVSGANTVNNSGTTNPGASATTPSTPATPTVPEVNNRDKEKAVCLNNNIGVGNTFVWASRYSNTKDYTTMVEDIQDPDNNTCFVRVELKSSDSKVKVSDIPAQYFEMGRTITCGAWTDEEVLKKRILDAKKSARTWGTVAGAVGGAAVGVGAMELFGNKLIGGKVEGQHALSGDELIMSQLTVAYKDGKDTFKEYYDKLDELCGYCEDAVWSTSGQSTPKECKQIGYKKLMAHMESLNPGLSREKCPR